MLTLEFGATGPLSYWPQPARGHSTEAITGSFIYKLLSPTFPLPSMHLRVCTYFVCVSQKQGHFVTQPQDNGQNREMSTGTILLSTDLTHLSPVVAGRPFLAQGDLRSCVAFSPHAPLSSFSGTIPQSFIVFNRIATLRSPDQLFCGMFLNVGLSNVSP